MLPFMRWSAISSQIAFISPTSFSEVPNLHRQILHLACNLVVRHNLPRRPFRSARLSECSTTRMPITTFSK
eukprot:5548453-Prymnesium_polylepis.2